MPNQVENINIEGFDENDDKFYDILYFYKVKLNFARYRNPEYAVIEFIKQ